MPIFEYVCEECAHKFEALVYGKEKATCPKCQSKAIDRVHRKDLLERFISKMRGKRLYRCLDCDHYFKDRPLTKR